MGQNADARLGAIRAQYSTRFVIAYKLAALVVAALSLAWSGIFVGFGNWTLAISQVMLALVCGVAWLLAHRGQLANALLVTQVAFLLSIAWLSLMFDVPSADVPRVSHIFLLVLALLGYLNFKRQPSAMQMVLIVICTAMFIALSSSNYAPPFAMPIDDDIRLVGAWFNAGIATLMLAGGIYVFQFELERADRRANELKVALWNKEFELFYQPQVDARGRVIGAEALLRWKHPKRGYVSPVEFIPLAEEAGLMDEIGRWVLESSCRTLVDWSRHPELRGLTLSANVSASQFLDEDFEQTVLHLIDTFEVNPTLFKLELTESVMVSNVDLVSAKMQILRSIGIGLALDDFGTGYSSLGYLRRLPLSQLKIDRSFVQDITENERSASLARSIIQIGRDLDMVVLAEGVETQAQFAFLRESGCDEFQGYYFGRPVPLAEFEQALMRKAA